MKKKNQKRHYRNGNSNVNRKKVAAGTVAATILLSANVLANADQVINYVLNEGNNDITVSGSTEYCKLQLEKDATIIVYSTSSSDTYGYLYDSEMTELTSDDDGGEENNFKFTYHLTAGETYYVGVRYYSSSDSGVIPVNLFVINDDDNGLKSSGTNWYYIEDGTLVTNAWRTIDGNRYYFGSSGEMYINRTAWIYDEDGNEDSYRFDENGHVVTGWYYEGEYEDEEGNVCYESMYYYDENGRGVKGFQTISGKLYYFAEEGRAYTNDTTSIYDNDEGKSYYYRFNADGSMVTGWYDDNYGNQYYYDENGRAVSGFVTVDDRQYYFDYNGRAYFDQTDSIYDEETDTYYYYRFDENGSMVTGWYDNGYGEWYYYDENGRGAIGLTVIGEDTYYFDYDGRRYTDYTWSHDGQMSYFGDDGKLVETIEMTEGLISFKGSKYYVREGNLVKNELILIDGIPHYFDYEGIMVTNTTRSIYDQETGKYYYYRFDADGNAMTGWYEDSYGNKYYYNEEFHAASGFVTIGGSTYYFGSDGRLYVNDTQSVYDQETGNYYYYRFDANGQVVKGWFETAYGDRYYYDENGHAVSGMVQIGDDTYYFEYNGKAERNYTVKENNTLFYFGESGKMEDSVEMTDGWVTFRGENYYVVDGDFVKGSWYTIDGKKYYFTYDGMMAKGTVKELYDPTTGNYNYYRFKNDGSVFTGWFEDEDGDRYYYQEDGCAVSGFQTIDGKLYYFSYGGSMCRNCTITTYDDETRRSYRIDDNGFVVIGWYETESWSGTVDRYYYDENGCAANGVTTVDGEEYYFNEDGLMQRDATVVVEGRILYFGEDGKLADSAVYKEGWMNFRGNYYYVEDGVIVKDAWRTIRGKKYYFYNEGFMACNTVLNLYDNTTHRYDYYRFGTDGSMVTGWFTDSDGRRYYYDENGRAAYGFTVLDGTHYYFGSSGKCLANLDENEVFVGDTELVLTESGRSYYKFVPTEDMVVFVYSKGGQNTYATLFDSKMNSLYSDDDGGTGNNFLICYQLTGGETYYLQMGFYNSDATGTISVTIDAATSDGWKKVADHWYYLEEGSLVSGWKTIGGKLYYFNESGMMATDTVLHLQSEDDKLYYFYRFNKDGNVVKGWYKADGDVWYYYDSKGHAVSGMTSIGGKTYYFTEEGCMQTDYVVIEEACFYYFGEDGVLAQSAEFKEGWMNFRGKWYYVEDGQLTAGTMKTISSKTYYFNSEGEMVTNEELQLYSSDSGRYHYYRFNSSGFMVTGWYKTESGDWYYYNSDGTAVSGMVTLKGKTYYFESNGEMQTDYSFINSTAMYYFGDDGILAESIDIEDGWLKFRDKWYYCEEGTLVRNAMRTIGGKTYYFNYNGEMVVNGTIERYDREDNQYHYYRFDENGQMVTGWYKFGSSWYYYDSKGRSAEGITTLGGKTYFFDYNGRMNTNTMAEDDSYLYYFGADGLLSEQMEIKNGWLKFKDHWYYVENNKLIKSKMKQIGSKTYYFSYDGTMSTNTSVSWWSDNEYVSYRFGADGVMVIGWYNDYDNTYYYRSDGREAVGMTEIDGDTYFFDNNGKMGRRYVTSDATTLYYFGGDGKLAETLTLKNGWNKFRDGWYYVQRGELVRDGLCVIGGKTYYFTESGQMAVNGAYEIIDGDEEESHYYRFDGAGLFVTGWYREGSDAWYYHDSGQAAEGLTMLEDQLYYFSREGKLQCNVVTADKEKIYYFDENGNPADSKALTTGWLKFRNKWYYVVDGAFATGVQNIGGTNYYFAADGVMIADLDAIQASVGDSTVTAGTERKYIKIVPDKAGVLTVFSDGSNDTIATLYDENMSYLESDDDGGRDMNFALSYGVKAGKTYYLSVGHYSLNNETEIPFTVTLTDSKGWNKIGVNWYYSDGSKFLKGWNTLSGKKYYFDSNGRMYVNKIEWLYDEDSNGHYYRFDASGNLVIGWFMDDYGEKYYYDENGMAVQGIMAIDDTTYYFEYNGRLGRNTVTMDETKIYRFGSDGKLESSKELKNGWLEFDGSWYYVKDGRMVRSDVIKSGGKYYLFDSAGRMFKNGSYTMNNVSYRAKEDGTLFENEWYVDSDSSGRYYYGENAEGCNGITEIAGKTYIFGDYGKCYTNTTIEYNGKVYLIDADGAATAAGNGWVQNTSTGAWSYVKDGELTDGIATISGAKYIFEDGVMVTDVIYYDHETEKYYIVTESGRVYAKKGWYQYKNSWYYVNEDQTLYEGALSDGGVKYMFSPAMVVSEEVVTDAAGKAYSVSGGGVLTEVTKDGFYNRNAISDIVYVSSGSILRKKWKTIDSGMYYFDETGAMLSNGIYMINGKSYYFDFDGKMAADQWVRRGSTLYYATGSGQLAAGKFVIDDLEYEFSDEGRLVSGVVYSRGTFTVYRGGVSIGQFSKDGWNAVGGCYYYVKNGELVKDSMLSLSDGIYAFDSSGVMVKNRIVNYSDHYYWIGSDGKAKTGWIKDGNTYYYANADNAWLAANESKTIGGKTYYFGSFGAMRTTDMVTDGKINSYNSDGTFQGTKEFANGWNYVNGVAYYYKDGAPYTGWVGSYYIRNGMMLRDCVVEDEDGALYFLDETGKYKKNCWINNEIEQPIIYVKSDGKVAKNEWLTIGGSKYYFRGIYVTRGIATIEGETYLFDSDGKLIEKVTDVASGWKKKNGNYYYMKQGEYVRASASYINGKWYFFDWFGVMTTDSVMDGYYYGTDGTRQDVTGFKKIKGDWYYFGEKHKAVNGFCQIGANWYYFESFKMVTGYQTIGNALFRFDSSGRLIGECTKANGWFAGGRNYYYFINGKMVTGTRLVIDNKSYYFDYNGVMVKDQVVYFEGGYRYADASGVIVSTEGWYTTSKGKIYVGNDGKALTGLWKISGTLYHFGYDGVLIS